MYRVYGKLASPLARVSGPRIYLLISCRRTLQRGDMRLQMRLSAYHFRMGQKICLSRYCKLSLPAVSKHRNGSSPQALYMNGSIRFAYIASKCTSLRLSSVCVSADFNQKLRSIGETSWHSHFTETRCLLSNCVHLTAAQTHPTT